MHRIELGRKKTTDNILELDYLITNKSEMLNFISFLVTEVEKKYDNFL